MIIQQFNNNITEQINDHQFKIAHIDYSPEKMSIILINDQKETQFKLMLDYPVFDNENFELNNAILTNVFIKDYKQVFSSKYFTCAYAEFIEQSNRDNKLKMRSGEVSN